MKVYVGYEHYSAVEHDSEPLKVFITELDALKWVNVDIMMRKYKEFEV